MFRIPWSSWHLNLPISSKRPWIISWINLSFFSQFRIKQLDGLFAILLNSMISNFDGNFFPELTILLVMTKVRDNNFFFYFIISTYETINIVTMWQTKEICRNCVTKEISDFFCFRKLESLDTGTSDTNCFWLFIINVPFFFDKCDNFNWIFLIDLKLCGLVTKILGTSLRESKFLIWIWYQIYFYDQYLILSLIFVFWYLYNKGCVKWPL